MIENVSHKKRNKTTSPEDFCRSRKPGTCIEYSPKPPTKHVIEANIEIFSFWCDLSSNFGTSVLARVVVLFGSCLFPSPLPRGH